MSATIRLYFGKRDYDAATQQLTSTLLAALGFTTTLSHTPGGDYIIDTPAPRAIALDAKRRARALHATSTITSA